MLDQRVREVYTYSESYAKEVKVPKLGLTMPRLNRNEKEVMKTLIDKGEITTRELAEYTNLNYNQIYRAIGGLKNKYYITHVGGRGRRISLSKLGILRGYLEGYITFL